MSDIKKFIDAVDENQHKNKDCECYTRFRIYHEDVYPAGIGTMGFYLTSGYRNTSIALDAEDIEYLYYKYKPQVKEELEKEKAQKIQNKEKELQNLIDRLKQEKDELEKLKQL